MELERGTDIASLLLEEVACHDDTEDGPPDFFRREMESIGHAEFDLIANIRVEVFVKECCVVAIYVDGKDFGNIRVVALLRVYCDIASMYFRKERFVKQSGK